MAAIKSLAELVNSKNNTEAFDAYERRDAAILIDVSSATASRASLESAHWRTQLRCSVWMERKPASSTRRSPPAGLPRVEI